MKKQSKPKKNQPKGVEDKIIDAEGRMWQKAGTFEDKLFEGKWFWSSLKKIVGG